MKMSANLRFLAFMLAFALILSVIPIDVLAVATLDTTVLDGKVKVTADGVSGKGTAVDNNDGTITVTSQATANCSGGKYSYTANDHTVLVTNNTADETLMVEFAYSASGLGTLTIDGTNMTATPTGTYSKSLAAGESVTIVVTSPATGSGNSGNTATIVLSEFALKDTGAKNVTVVKTDGGTTSVNGTALSADSVTLSTDYATGVAVSATPASGYVFLAWVDGDYNVLSTQASATIQPLTDMTIAAAFVPNDTQGYWLAGNALHTDLNEAAAAAAASSNKTVVLLKNATLPSGTYTIPAGVKMVIPKDQAITTYGEEPALSANGAKFVNPTAYRTLTMTSGAKLVINGELELVAQHHVSSGSSAVTYGGAIDGAYGHIATEEGAAIEVNGTLYAWGIISGEGVVTAFSGGTIYEKMQVNDYRGGTATSALATTYSSRKLFPFSQYYVQNVEVKEVIHAGATLKVDVGVYLSAPEQSSVAFVGSNGAMFTMSEGAYVTKEYDAENDRLKLDAYGNTALSSISLSFEGQSVNSASFRLGINNNIDIHIHSGVTTISQEVVLQSGATVTVDREATIYNTTNLYVMDAEDWGTYARGNLLMPVKWSYANGTTVKRTSVADAIVDINGTIINAGQIFSSGSDSIISSQKTGVYALLTPATGSDSIYQLDHNSFTLGMTSDWVTIAFTSAVLVNGDGTTVTAEGSQYDAYIYDSVLDRWVQTNIYNDGAGYTATVTYSPNGGNGTAFTTVVDYFGEAAAFLGSNYTAMNPYSFAASNCDFTREGYTFIGWSTDPNATTAMVTPGQYITISADTTLYAVWSANSYSLVIDGVSQEVPFGSDLSAYIPAAPTKDGYTFAGWTVTTADGTPITAPATMPAYDVIFTANWEQIKSYTLTFLDENGDVIGEYSYEAGQQVTATYPAYTKENYVITWSAEIPATLTGDVEISAIATPNVYTITYIVDGTEAGDDQATESNNWTVTLLKPTKTGFTFMGWAYAADTAADITADVNELALTGDVTLYAVWSANAYTVTFYGVGEPVVLTYAYGDAITAPADPEMEGYTFTGWANRDDGSDVPATMPAKNLIFDAQWEQIVYTLSWDVDGDGNVDSTTSVAHNGYVGTLPEAVVPGMTATIVYTLNGWTDANGTAVDASTVVTGDMTITANIVASDRYYYLAGLIDGEWGEVEANKMIPNGDGTYTFTVHLNPGSWEFKVRSGDAWYGCSDTTIENNTAGYKYNFYGDNNNCVFKSTEAATYTFVWDTADNTLVVTWVPDHTHDYEYSFQWKAYYAGCTVTASCECGQTSKNACDISASVNGDTITLTATYEEASDVVSLYYADINAFYYENSASNWNQVYAYAWGDSGDMSTWPGTAMTKVSGYENLYMIIVPDDCNMIIFNNNTGSQTHDLTIPTNGLNVAVSNGTQDPAWGYVEPAQYTVTWDVDGKLTTETYYYGQTPVFTGSTDKAPTAEYTYIFTSWDKEITTVTGDVTYTAQYRAVGNRYFINFRNEDGTPFEADSLGFEYGTEVNWSVIMDIIGTPEKEGYVFAGWVDAQGNPATNLTTMPAHDVDVYATWNKVYNVTYRYVDMDGIDQEYYTVTGIAGDVITLDTMNWWNYATFAGWDADGDGIVDYADYEEYTITGDAVLYAVFTPWFGNVDLGAEDATFVDAEGNPITVITAQGNANWVEMTNFPVRPGYTFVGWLGADGNEFLVDTDEETGVSSVTVVFSGNNDLTALWKANTYTITFSSANGLFADVTIEVAYGQTVTADMVPNTEFEHYEFAQWFDWDTTDVITFPMVMPARNMNIRSAHSPVHYQAPVNFENGAEAGWLEYRYAQDVDRVLGELNDYYGTPVREGYTFIGWELMDGNTGYVYQEHENLTTDNLIITALWKANTYTITFSSANGLFADVTIEVAYGQTVTADMVPNTEFEHYEFAQWFDWDTTDVITFPMVMPARNMNIRSAHSPVHYQAPVNFENGAEAGWLEYRYAQDVDRVLGELNDYYGTPVREGYTFIGWELMDGNTGYVYQEHENLTTDNLIITALWEINTYTVTYNINGEVYTTTDFVYGSVVTAPEYTASEGYTFSGWNVPATMPAENITLDATLSINSYTVTWIVDGVETQETYNYGETPVFTGSTDKAQDGCTVYTFDGWDKEIVAVNGDITYTATYTTSLSHTKGQIVEYVLSEGDCQTEGEKQVIVYCSVCGGEISNEIVFTGYGDHDWQDATCTEAMWCGICGETEGEALGHSWTDATCTDPKTCSVCGDTEGEALGHSYEATGYEWAADYSTCTVTGTCSVCGGTTTETGYSAVSELKPANCVAPAYLQFIAGFNAEWAETQTTEAYDPAEVLDPNVHAFGTRYIDNGDGTHTEICVACNTPVADAEPHNKVNVQFAGNCVAEAVYQCSKCSTIHYGEKNYDNHAASANKPVDNGDGTHTMYYPCCNTPTDIVEEHTFAESNGTYKCACGALYNGIFKDANGDLYFVENGVAVENKGLVQAIDENGLKIYYYFGCGIEGCSAGDACQGNFKAQKSCRHYAGITNGYLVEGGYTIGDDGIIEHTENLQGIQTLDGTKYYLIDGVKVAIGLVKVDGEYYYARSNGALVIGQDYYISKTNGLTYNGEAITKGSYTFDADGKIVWAEPKNGIYAEDGSLYYYVDGVRNYAGLIIYTGDLNNADGTVTEGVYDNAMIYVNTKGEVKNSCTYWISKNNGLIEKNRAFTFDANGIVVEDEKNGFYFEDGFWYYYVDGSKNYAGLIWCDGPEGNDPGYYYINSKCQMITDCTYWISKNNGYMSNQAYIFGANGKMEQVTNDSDELLEGFVEENGELYYYENGIKTYAGLILVDGNYYYVNSKCQVIRDCTYWISKNNGYMKNGAYTFDANGVMVTE